MNAKFGFFVAAFLFAGFVLDADAKTVYRDALGRKQGTSETDRYGKTTYRDAQGRIQGSKKD